MVEYNWIGIVIFLINQSVRTILRLNSGRFKIDINGELWKYNEPELKYIPWYFESSSQKVTLL